VSSDGSGSKIFDPGWVGFEFGKFPLKMSNFLIFSLRGQKKSLQVGLESTRVKGGSASYLLRVKSKLGLGQGPALFVSDLPTRPHLWSWPVVKKCWRRPMTQPELTSDVQ